MESIIVTPIQQPRFQLPIAAVKFFFLALFALSLGYVFYHFSAAYLGLFALVSGLVLAIAFRIENIQMHVGNSRRATGNTCADGGTFHSEPLKPVTVSARAVVHDGGSFERSSVNLKAGS